MYISLHDTYTRTPIHVCVRTRIHTHMHAYANKHTERIHSILECALTIDDLGVCLYVSNGPLELAPLFVVVIAKLPDCLPGWLAGWLVGWLVGCPSQPPQHWGKVVKFANKHDIVCTDIHNFTANVLITV